MPRPQSGEEARARYAREVCAAARVDNPRVIQAFSSVPREAFSPPGPWKVYRPSQTPPYFNYEVTATDHPDELYRDVSIELAPGSFINNGLPSVVASWLGDTAPAVGGSVVQIGAGLGYYTAILAHLVGEGGRVLAAEISRPIGAQAARNLSGMGQVDLFAGDGCNLKVEGANLVLVHAGISDLPPAWLRGLAPGGALVVSLTFTSPEFRTIGLGVTLKIRPHSSDRFSAAFVSTPYITTSHSLRSDEGEQRLREAMEAPDYSVIASVRLDRHEAAPSCWLHRQDWCVSRLHPSEQVRT
jgi:protein-L-isoaspartate(D-aspartate) O-methyltransferase